MMFKFVVACLFITSLVSGVWGAGRTEPTGGEASHFGQQDDRDIGSGYERSL